MRVVIRKRGKNRGNCSVKSNQAALVLSILTFLLLSGMAYAAPTISVKYNGADLPGNGYLTMNTPTIDVTITPDAGVELDAATFAFLLDGTSTGATLNGTTSSFAVTTPLSDSTHTISITIKGVDQQDGTPSSHSFKVDTLNPTLTASVAWSTTVANTQVLTAGCTDSASDCTVEYKVPSQNGGNYQTYSGVVSFTGTDETLTVRAKDALDHVSAEQTFTLNTDVVAPTFSLSASTSFTKDKTPALTITATDALSGLASATIQCSGGNTVTKTMTTSPLTIEDFDVTANGCPTGDGSRDLTIKVKDVAGNESAGQTLAIKYDGTAPDAPENLDDTDVTEDLIAMDWSAADNPGNGSDLDKYFVYRHTDNDFDDADNVATIQSDDDLEFSDDGLDACEDYFYWITALDEAGNESDESSVLDVTTDGCSSNNDDDDNDTTTTTTTTSGGGGGGAGTTCNVTFDIPASVYAGETITAKVSGSTYANGYFRVTPDGKATVKIDQSGLAKSSWSGPYLIPATPIGIKLTFRFGADGCISSVTRNVKDPATKNVIATTTPTPAPPSENTIPVLQSNTAPKVEPSTTTVALLLDALPTFMGSAGFNAENTAMQDGITSLLNSWKYIKTVSVVPGTDEGKYSLRITLSMENTTKNGTIKIVEEVPKSFAESASQLEANYPMTVLKDDPLIQFEITGLTEGQKVDVHITGKEQYDIDEANKKAAEVAGDATTPSLLFASGTAGSAPNAGDGRPLVDITGLASGVGSVAPFVIGLIVFAGIILVSVRVVRGSVEGADNPILRSASGIERGGSRTLRAPPSIKGRKIWKKDDAY